MAFETLFAVCQFAAVAGGITDFYVDAATAGHKTPVDAEGVSGNSYPYWAQSADGEQWEEGSCTLVVTTDDQYIIRDAVSSNSSDTTDLIDFTDPPIVTLFPAATNLELPSASYVTSEIETLKTALSAPTGTAMVFYQAAAPTGWTKQTTHNDKAMRVVSGTGAGSGGSVDFSTCFGRYQTDGHANSISEMPSHYHSEYTGVGGSAFMYGYDSSQYGTGAVNQQALNTGSTGGGGSHVHGMDIRVKYIDVIIATKDAPA